MLGPTPTATYRFQLTPSFGFERVVDQLDRLQAIGVSHPYLSPVTQAVPGSTHGYDVVDHAQVRDELGGVDGLTRLLDECAARGMGVLVDHVPNHCAVGRPELNGRWWAMLRDGAACDSARWFDVDWPAGGGKVILPVLGDPLDEIVARLAIVDGELTLGSQRWPLAAGTESMPPPEALERQHYRLQWWRAPERNVRRFFTIDDLVAVRVEDALVAAVVDTVPRLLADHPGFAGVRVDHVDGLADPLGYLDQLHTAIGDRWLLVEKILAVGETLPLAWPVDGTTGYEHAVMVEQALLDRDGWGRLRDRWVSITADDRPFRQWELAARREVLDGGLRPDLERVTRVAAAGVDGTSERDSWVEPVEVLTLHLERYRTYLPDDEGVPALDEARAEAAAARPDLAPPLDRLADALDEPGEWRTRWQQLTGPATAKGVEDRAFWRFFPLASLGEVGGRPEPDVDVDPHAALHGHHALVADRWPRTLLAGTTHDTKRAEDVRAAGLALAADADRFVEVFDAWLDGPGATIGCDPAMHWMAVQTAVTCAHIDVDRLHAFLVKAAREADQHTSWAEPDAGYEATLAVLARAVLGWSPVTELTATLHRPGMARSLALLAVRLTAPGVADVYQGTEGWRYVLVDPDNRGEPDHAALDALAERSVSMDGPTAWAEDGAPAARPVVISRLLRARGELDLVGYVPIEAGDDLLAFARTDSSGDPVMVTIVPRGATSGTVELPHGRWRHVLADGEPAAEGSLDVADALTAFPAVVLVPSE